LDRESSANGWTLIETLREYRGSLAAVMRRAIAVGDIHGCSLALKAMVDAIDPGPDNLLVTLGDYIDRGRTAAAS
jgi:Calcineurin-like phosphoesterase